MNSMLTDIHSGIFKTICEMPNCVWEIKNHTALSKIAKVIGNSGERVKLLFIIKDLNNISLSTAISSSNHGSLQIDLFGWTLILLIATEFVGCDSDCDEPHGEQDTTLV